MKLLDTAAQIATSGNSSTDELAIGPVDFSVPEPTVEESLPKRAMAWLEEKLPYYGPMAAPLLPGVKAANKLLETPKAPGEWEDKFKDVAPEDYEDVLALSDSRQLEDDPIGNMILSGTPTNIASRFLWTRGASAVGKVVHGAIDSAVSVMSDALVINPMLNPFREKYPNATMVADLALGIGLGMSYEDAISNAAMRVANRGASSVVSTLTQLRKDNPLSVSQQFFKDHGELIDRANRGDLHAMDQLTAQVGHELRDMYNVKEDLVELFDKQIATGGDSLKRVELSPGQKVALTPDEVERMHGITLGNVGRSYVKEFKDLSAKIVAERVDSDYDDVLKYLEKEAAKTGGFDRETLVAALVYENPSWQVAARRVEGKQLQIATDYANALVDKVKQRFPELVSDVDATKVDPGVPMITSVEFLWIVRAAKDDNSVRVTDMLSDLATVAKTRGELTAYWRNNLQDEFGGLFKAEVAARAAEKESDHLHRYVGKPSPRAPDIDTRLKLFEAVDKSKRRSTLVVRSLLGANTDLRAALRETIKNAARDITRADKLRDKAWIKTFRETVMEAHLDYRAKLQARQEVLSMVSELRGMMSNRSVAGEYHEQIYGWLYPHFNRQLSGRVHKPLSDLRTFLQKRVTEHNELGADMLLREFEPLFGMSRRAGIHDMTVEQLADVHRFMKALTHVGRAARRIQDEADDILVGHLVRQIERTATPLFKNRFEPKPQAERLGPRQQGLHHKYLKAVEKLAPLEAGLQRVEYICHRIDGFKYGGVAWKYIYSKAVTAQELASRLHKDLMRTRYKGVWDKYRTATGGSLQEHMNAVVGKVDGNDVSREKAILMHLHLQADDNAELLLKGLKTEMDRGQLDTLVESLLSVEDKALANGILDLLDETFPMLAKVHESLTGLTLQQVRGRYMPMRQAGEVRRYGKEEESFIDVILDASRKGEVRDVQRHILKTRVGGLTELDLSFDSITQHLHDVVHVTSHAELLRDVNKILSDPKFKRTIDNNLGADVRKELDNWLRDLAIPAHTEIPVLKQIRQNVAVVVLGLDAVTAAKQFLGLVTAAGKVSPVRMVQAFSSMAKRKFNNDDIMGLSLELPARWDNRIRECAEAARVYDPFKSAGLQSSPAQRDAFMSWSNWTDQMTSEIVWRGAYADGMAKYADRDEMVVLAADYADQIVRGTQGSSATKDQSRWLRSKNEGVRYLTMFQYYFNSFYNQLSELVQQGRFDPNMSKTRAATTMLFLAAAPAVIQETAGAVFDFARGVDVETNILKETVINASGTIPVIRDLVSSAVTGFDYNVTPVTRVPRAAIALARVPFTGKNKAERATKAGATLGGAIFGYPTDAVVIAAEGAMRLMKDQTNDPFELLMRPEK